MTPTFWFGDSRWVGSNARIGAPVGLRCLLCDERIRASDSGVTAEFIAEQKTPLVTPDGKVVAEMTSVSLELLDGRLTIAAHAECYARDTYGSVGHQLRRCPCYGGDFTDDPRVSKRQQALEAYRVALSLASMRVPEPTVAPACDSRAGLGKSMRAPATRASNPNPRDVN